MHRYLFIYPTRSKSNRDKSNAKIILFIDLILIRIKMAKIVAIFLLIIGFLKFTQSNPLINPKLQQILINHSLQKRQGKSLKI